MTWNSVCFDSTGKIKDARVGSSNAWSYAGIPYPTETTTELTALGYTAWPYDPCLIPAPDLPDPWTSDQAGFYYIDNEIGTNTGRTYGNPTAPRSTIPSLSAGDVVVMNGDYSADINGTNFVGTSSDPIFIVNASGGDARWRGRFQIGSSSEYLIVDGVDGWWPSSGGTGKASLDGSFCCYRNATLDSDESTVGYGGCGVSGDHQMLYNLSINGSGWYATPTDQDTHGTGVSPGASQIWIIDCDYSRCSGDGVQVAPGTNGSSSTFTDLVFIGGCTADDNRQSGFWAKDSQYVIMSNNTVSNMTGGAGGDGLGLGGQYKINGLYALFNTVYACNNGISFRSRSSSGTDPEIRCGVIGNLVYETTGTPSTSGTSPSAQQVWSCPDVHIIDNTYIDCASSYNAVNSAYAQTIHGNIFGEPTNGTGRSMMLENSNAGNNSDYNVFEESETIVWETGHANTDTLASHQSSNSEDANSIDDTRANIDFVDDANDNYHLDTGSVARDASTEHQIYADFEALFGLDIRVDRDGTPRPTSGPWDAGCYQDS